MKKNHSSFPFLLFQIKKLAEHIVEIQKFQQTKKHLTSKNYPNILASLETGSQNGSQELFHATEQLKLALALAAQIHFSEGALLTNNEIQIKKDDTSIWLTAQGSGLVKRIRFDEICWLQSKDKKTYIITDQEEIGFSCTLSQFEKRIAHPSWQRIHKSFIINYTRASSLDLTERAVYVERNGEATPVSIGDKFVDSFKNRIHLVRTRS